MAKKKKVVIEAKSELFDEKISKFKTDKSNGKRKPKQQNKGRRNDVSWYIADQQLLKDTASLPFTYALGGRLELGTWARDINKTAVPGIMAIMTSPTYGWSNDSNSPINVASRKLMTYLRHSNSGRTNYDAPDLMLYLMAMDSAHMFLAWMKRVYGILSTYNPQNRYYPQAAVYATGANYEDLIVHMADFRAFINTFALKLSSMCIPNDFGYLNKHRWLYEGIYSDKPIAKAQTYMYTPNHRNWPVFTLEQDSTGSLVTLFLYMSRHYEELSPGTVEYSIFTKLESINDCGDSSEGYIFDRDPGIYTFTLNEIRAIGNMIMDPILDEQDFVIMSGDILKSYGDGGVQKTEGITETYSVVPGYNSLVLDQIQNTSLMGCMKPAYIYVDEDGSETIDWNFPTGAALLRQTASGTYPYLPNGTLTSTPVFNHPYGFGAKLLDAGANIWLTDRIITFENDAPVPEQIMEATRLSNIARSYSLTKDCYVCETLGSEVAEAANIWYYDSVYNETLERDEWRLVKSISIFQGMTDLDIGVFQIDPNDPDITNFIITDSEKDLANSAGMNKLIQMVSNFSRHPMISMTSAQVDLDNNRVEYAVINGLFFEIDNYTIVNKNNLKLLSEQALLGQLKSYSFG